MSKSIRLQKILADCGVGSRRTMEQAILDGRVSLNGMIVTEMGIKADISADTILLDGKPINVCASEQKIYAALNKPLGVVSTASDEQNRPKITDFLPEEYGRLFPVGRLDINTSGLILLTNDGEWANRISHPKYETEKEYITILDRDLTAPEASRISRGVDIGGFTTSPAKVIRKAPKTYSVAIHEGRKRQVRLMFAAVGAKVTQLTRIRIKNLHLGTLEPGKHRLLSEEEVQNLSKPD